MYLADKSVCLVCQKRFIPIMQKMDSKDVAKAIVEEFHNEKGLSQVVSKPSTKSNKGRKSKAVTNTEKPEFTVEKGEKTE